MISPSASSQPPGAPISVDSPPSEVDAAIDTLQRFVNGLDAPAHSGSALERNCFQIKQQLLQLGLRIRNIELTPIRIISKLYQNIFEVQIDNRNFIMKQYPTLDELNEELFYYEAIRKQNPEVVVKFADEFMDVLRRQMFFFEFRSPYFYTMERPDLFRKILDIFDDLARNEDFGHAHESHHAALKAIKSELHAENLPENRTEGIRELLNFCSYVLIINKIIMTRKNQKLYILLLHKYRCDLKTFARECFDAAKEIEQRRRSESQSDREDEAPSSSSKSQSSMSEEAQWVPPLADITDTETIESILNNVVCIANKSKKFLVACQHDQIIPIDIKCSNILIDDDGRFAFSDLSYTRDPRNMFKIYTDGHFPKQLFNKEELTNGDKEHYVTFQFGVLLCEFMFQCMGLNIHKVKGMSDNEYIKFLVDNVQTCFKRIECEENDIYDQLRALIVRSVAEQLTIEQYIDAIDKLDSEFDLSEYENLEEI